MPADATWYRVDNAGKVFCSVGDQRVTALFRLSVTLKRVVNVTTLQKALNNLMPRLPYYAVQIRPGFFWYYFEENREAPKLTGDSRFPCLNFAYQRSGSFPFRVRVFGRRIAIEMAHALSDGTGTLIFLKSLVAEYLRLGGASLSSDEGIFIPDSKPADDEFEDAFSRYYNPQIPPAPSETPAFHLPYPNEPRGVYHVTTGILPLKQTLALAKERQVSLNDLLLAIYMDAFQHVLKSMPPRLQRRSRKPIRIDVPVNLRPHFKSATMRNFFLPVSPNIDPRLGEYTFDEILRRVHHFMRTGIDQKYLSQQITRNIIAEKKWLHRLMPLTIKNRVLSMAYDRFSGERTTSSLSNLGLVTLPDSIANDVERFEFVPAPPTARKIACGAVSYGDKLIITFGRMARESIVEACFFRWFTANGVSVAIETNGGA